MLEGVAILWWLDGRASRLSLLLRRRGPVVVTITPLPNDADCKSAPAPCGAGRPISASITPFRRCEARPVPITRRGRGASTTKQKTDQPLFLRKQTFVSDLAMSRKCQNRL